jgi:hypothetical protein
MLLAASLQKFFHFLGDLLNPSQDSKYDIFISKIDLYFVLEFPKVTLYVAVVAELLQVLTKI